MTQVAALINHFKHLYIICFLACALLQAEEPSTIKPVFIPPKNWEQAHASMLRPSVKVGFFNKTGKEFNPSINFTEEKTSLSASDYLKAVQKTHESNQKNRWRKLGTIETLSGTAFLTAIETTTPLGEIRILQSILVKEDTAYILTSATLKEQSQKYQKEILAAFKSLILTKSAEEVLVDLDKKKKFEEKKKELLAASLTYQKKGKDLFEDPSFKKQLWKPFKAFLNKEFAEQGSYWQFIILEETEKKLVENPLF